MPISTAHGWGRDVFSLALAIQMLAWGAAQPFIGAIADRFGPTLVLSAGAVLYALGLATMPYATTPAMLQLTAGVLIGLGLAGSSFTIVIAAFGKLMPKQWRSLAFGAGTAAGSFGQFVFSPLAVALITITAGRTRSRYSPLSCCQWCRCRSRWPRHAPRTSSPASNR